MLLYLFVFQKADGQRDLQPTMSSVTSPLPSITAGILKMRREYKRTEENDDSEPEVASPECSPPPATQAPPSPASSPVMLATMTPVEYEDPPEQKTVIYLPPGQPAQETGMYEGSHDGGNPVSVVVPPPGTQLMNQTATYQGPPGTTVLVLSELVEDMSPFLGLR